MKYLVVILLLLGSISLSALELGDAVMTKFSGVVAPKANEKFPKRIKLPKGLKFSQYNDELMIDVNAPSLIVKSLQSSKEHIWDASVLQHELKLSIKAKDIGQVFGIAIDDAKVPNIYATATSFYGLNIVTNDIPNKLRINKKPFITGDVDTRPERQVRGRKEAYWMAGQFGKGGTPGTVWKINSKSGKVTKLIDIKLDGKSNSGPALGNIAYDRAHKQLFVSDLDTGMIHRVSLNGQDLGHYDHGIEAREVYGLKPIVLNPFDRADIKSRNFDSTNRKTWGYARAGRLVYGLAVAKSRLFYAVYNGKDAPSEIWSVALDKKGNFVKKSSRFELRLGGLKANMPVTDIAVTNDGKMFLAQRALNVGSYSMQNFLNSVDAQVVVYHLKKPQDGRLNRWYQEPQEYSIGLEAPYRKARGGVAIGYGYDIDGNIDYTKCGQSIWASGENVRKSAELSSIFGEDVNGAIGMPVALNSVNRPPLYSLYNSVGFNSYISQGEVGDIEIFAKACSCKCSDVDYGEVNDVQAPVGDNGESIAPASEGKIYSPPSGGGGGGNPTGTGNPTGGGKPTGSGGITVGIPDLIDCNTFPNLAICKDDEQHGEPKKVCMLVKTSPPGPFEQEDGSWQLPLYDIESLNGMNIDSMKITVESGASGISNGEVFAVGIPLPEIAGAVPGRDVVLNLCGFDSTQVTPGKPYECCNTKIKIQIGQDGDQKLEVVK